MKRLFILTISPGRHVTYQDGDLIELETAGLGRLRFNVRDDLRRTWGRETRLEMHNTGIEGTPPTIRGQVRASAALSAGAREEPGDGVL